MSYRITTGKQNGFCTGRCILLFICTTNRINIRKESAHIQSHFLITQGNHDGAEIKCTEIQNSIYKARNWTNEPILVPFTLHFSLSTTHEKKITQKVSNHSTNMHLNRPKYNHPFTADMNIKVIIYKCSTNLMVNGNIHLSVAC